MKILPTIAATFLLGAYGTAVAQQGTSAWPPIPQAPEIGIEFLSRQPEWGVDSPPIFLREKALIFQSQPLSAQGRIVAIANPGGDGKGHNNTVFSLKKVLPVQNGASNKVDEIFYNGLSRNSFYSPLFSPDGQTVVFRLGLPPDDVQNAFGLASWNLRSGVIKNLPLETQDEFKSQRSSSTAYFNPGVSWSPGGRYISYVRGGDSVGGYFNRLGQPYSPDGYELWLYDLKSNGFSRRLQANVGLSWSWTHHGTVLYAPVSTENSTALRTRAGRPSIYEIGASGGAPKKLFDGGYFAQESPDGQWIAFADWPGPLFEENSIAPAQAKALAEVKPGLYLFHRPTQKRILVGEFPDAPPLPLALQWAPDSRSFNLLNTQQSVGEGLSGVLYRVETEQQTLNKIGEINPKAPLRTANTSSSGWFEFRGTSPDGKYLYANTTEYIDDGPKNYVNDRHTLLAIESATGKATPIASLTDIANENPGWDWHDDSGQNPAFTAAQKIENALAAEPAAAARPTAKPKPRARTRRRTGP